MNSPDSPDDDAAPLTAEDLRRLWRWVRDRNHKPPSMPSRYFLVCSPDEVKLIKRHPGATDPGEDRVTVDNVTYVSYANIETQPGASAPQFAADSWEDACQQWREKGRIGDDER